MPWRFTICLAALFLAVTCGVAQAQGPYPMSPGWGPSGMQAPGEVCPPGQMPGGQYIGGGPQLRPEEDVFYDHDSRIDLIIRETVRRAYFRVEYLNWNISNPGNRLLGAQMQTLDPRVPFQAIDPGNVPRPGVNAFVPDLADVDFDGMNGIRLSLGLPTELGALEADVWGVSSSKQGQKIQPEIDTQTLNLLIPAVTLSVNGAPSDTSMILFDNGYRSEISSGMWGTQANFVFNPVTPGEGFTLRPLAGVKYVTFYEQLRIKGSDIATGTNPSITSKSNNNFVGPQVGFRAALDSKWLSLGVEPKLMLGINRHQDSVAASQIFDVANPDVLDRKEDTDFAPVFSMPSYARLHLGENFSLFAGYEILCLSEASRASEQIIFDGPPLATDPSQIRLKKHRENVFAHGFNVGAEFRFR